MSDVAPTITLVGRLVQASNATFLATDPDGVRHVYKPVAGEAPLWDFPRHTLARREVAAFDLSAAAGFDVVPPTRYLDGGPLGPGSLQQWIDPTDEVLCDLVGLGDLPSGWFGVVVGVDADDKDVALVHADDDRLRRLALFDIIVNNADRKAGHIITGEDKRVVGVDHGVCFHTEPKLRTVLWGWAGDPLTDDELALVANCIDAVHEALAPWLSDDEIDACRGRAEALLAAGVWPEPGDTWPMIPWPPI